MSAVNVKNCSAHGAYSGGFDSCPVCGGIDNKRKGRKKTTGAKPKKSALEAQFAAYYKMLAPDLPALKAEYRFHPIRKWRFDFALIDLQIAIELEGGVYGNGRHNRAKGFIADCDKYNAATVLGWRLLRYTSEHLKNPLAMIGDIRALVDRLSQQKIAA